MPEVFVCKAAQLPTESAASSPTPAWVPFIMQRLDNEYMMRSSEAPLLKRKPSDYMREKYFTTQPLEITDMGALEQR